MQIHEIAGHIQTLYLVEYPEGFLLLDGGCRCDVDMVLTFIEKLGRRPEELRAVVVTHMHPDHAGGAQLFRKRTGAHLISGDGVADWYAGLDGSIQHLIDILLAYWVASRMDKPWRWLWYPKTLRFDHVLADGEVLPQFPEWSVLATPGHTGKDISLLHKASSRLYLADVILKVRGRYLAPFPIEFPELYEKTLRMLQKLGIRELMMAHGGQGAMSFQDFQAVLESLPGLPRKRDVFASIVGKLVKI